MAKDEKAPKERKVKEGAVFKIREMLADGETDVATIQKKVGCAIGTVRIQKCRYNKENGIVKPKKEKAPKAPKAPKAKKAKVEAEA
jgi:hypothetical protein